MEANRYTLSGKKCVASLLTISLVALLEPRPARAGGVFLGATEITQLLNHAELVSQYLQQVQQYQTQLQQWQNEIKQAAMLPQQTFSQVEAQLVGLQSVVQGGNALSYAMANMDSQFTSRFASLGYQPGTSYAQRYATWSKTAMDTTQKTLDAAHYQNQQVATQAALLQQLQQDAKSADGQEKAIQTGNEIAAEEANQLLQLRELMMADIQSKAAFQAKQIAEEDEQKRSAGFYNSVDLFDGQYARHP